LHKSRQIFAAWDKNSAESELARRLLYKKQDQPGRGIEFKNLGEGLNSGTTGLFLFFEKSGSDRPFKVGEDPALMARIRIVSQSVSDRFTPATAKKGGETHNMKFATIAAVAALAIAALGLGACASKSAPAPAPSSIGTSK